MPKKETKKVNEKETIKEEKKENVKEILKDKLKQALEEIEKEKEKDEYVFDGTVLELKDGFLKTYPKKQYKKNNNDYIVPGNGFYFVNKDIKDIRPYARYLNNNKREKLRHNIILYMGIGMIYVIFTLFSIKGNIKDIKEVVVVDDVKIENVEEKTSTGGFIKEKIESIIPAPIENNIEDGKGQGIY